MSKIVASRYFEISKVDSRVYGSLIEHMGRCVYEGIYEPDSPYADEDGFRKDVLDLVRELGVTIVRYPGGNFLSGYDWKDGIGPRSERPQKLDLAWHSLETNQFGLDEFMKWCRKAGVEPMMAVNLGTGQLQDALEILEYTNVVADSYWANEREKNGSSAPYRVKVWCLGNEMDGPWQLGHKNATDYGKIAADVARGMRQIDEDLELVVCGSSGRGLPTFGQWESTVLEHTYELIDHISLHIYVEEDNDLQSFLVCSVDLDRFIDEVVSIADSIKAKKRSEKTVMLSFDEWNVWRVSEFQKLPRPKTWEKAPRIIEDTYTVADAVVVGNMLISLLRHSDRVKMACMAQLVNVIAPIRTEVGKPAWRQTIFYPFSLTAKYGQGTALRTLTDSPKISTKKYGTQDAIDSICIFNKESGEIAVFMVNRDTEQSHKISVDLDGFSLDSVIEQATLTDSDVHKTNSVDAPNSVTPNFEISSKIEGNTVRVSLPPVSWQMVRVSLKASV